MHRRELEFAHPPQQIAGMAKWIVARADVIERVTFQPHDAYGIPTAVPVTMALGDR